MAGEAKTGEPAILERRGELEAIAATLDPARAGSGRSLLIWGSAGLGKSRLVAAAGEMAEEGR